MTRRRRRDGRAPLAVTVYCSCVLTAATRWRGRGRAPARPPWPRAPLEVRVLRQAISTAWVITWVRSVLPPTYFAYCSTARTSCAGSRRGHGLDRDRGLGWMRRRDTGPPSPKPPLRRLPGGGQGVCRGDLPAASWQAQRLARAYGHAGAGGLLRIENVGGGFSGALLEEADARAQTEIC
jgi:hypothetical protein